MRMCCGQHHQPVMEIRNFCRLCQQRLRPVLTLCFFAIFLVIGVAAFRDYGVSADEPAMRKFGNDSFAYLFLGGPAPAGQDWAFFNPVAQVMMRGIELALGLTDGADIWFMRHFFTFLMFFLTVVLFYRIAILSFGGWKAPLLGSVMFMLSPRLFAHGFYNPKDVPAMLFFTMSAWTLLRLLEKRTIPRLCVHAVSAAVLISMRPFGLMMPALAMVFLCAGRISTAKKVASGAAYLLVLALILILVWPFLWHDPIRGLIGALFNNASRLGGGFYFGEQVSAAGVPWHYLPVWIGITTPVVYSLFFVIGFSTLWIRLVMHPLRLLREKPASALALFWFSLPIAALLIFPIGIFDEWRHMLFIYPAFLLMALEGVQRLILILGKFRGTLAARLVIYGLLGFQMGSTGIWMLRNHPFEYAYFSIPARLAEGKFELDYWGLSYRAGLEWVLKNDAREHINVFVAARTGKAAADTLPLKDWNRLYFVEPGEANYILDNFRGSGYAHVFAEEKKAHAITVDGVEILGIYRR